MSYLRIHTLVSALVLLAALGCSSARPHMKVLGVKALQMQQVDKSSVKVFVEVHNPSSESLELRRMQYRIVAERWFDAKGQVRVRRSIPAGASAVVQIVVPVRKRPASESMRGVPYRLDARLFAISDKTERSWLLKAKGKLSSSERKRIRPLRVANRF